MMNRTYAPAFTGLIQPATCNNIYFFRNAYLKNIKYSQNTNREYIGINFKKNPLKSRAAFYK